MSIDVLQSLIGCNISSILSKQCMKFIENKLVLNRFKKSWSNKLNDSFVIDNSSFLYDYNPVVS